jgi:IS5 family transposase
MSQCQLKGSKGDSLHSAAGFNIRCLLRMIVNKGFGHGLRLLQVAGWGNLLGNSVLCVWANWKDPNQ